MATQSILENIVIKQRRESHKLLRALDKASEKKLRRAGYSKQVEVASKESLKKIFDEEIMGEEHLNSCHGVSGGEVGKGKGENMETEKIISKSEEKQEQISEMNNTLKSIDGRTKRIECQTRLNTKVNLYFSILFVVFCIWLLFISAGGCA